MRWNQNNLGQACDLDFCQIALLIKSNRVRALLI